MILDDVLSEIAQGKFDSEFTRLDSAVRRRTEMLRQQVANRVAYTLDIDDTVRLRDIRPKYLNGQLATVVQVNRKRAVINVNNASLPARVQGDITVPLTCIEIIKGK